MNPLKVYKGQLKHHAGSPNLLISHLEKRLIDFPIICGSNKKRKKYKYNFSVLKKTLSSRD